MLFQDLTNDGARVQLPLELMRFPHPFFMRIEAVGQCLNPICPMAVDESLLFPVLTDKSA